MTNALETLIQRAGLNVAWRSTDDGQPYAALRWGEQPGHDHGFALVTRGPCLSILAPELPDGSARVDPAAPAQLPLARSYRRTDTGRTELAIGMVVGAAEAATLDLRPLLAFAAAALDYLAGAQGPPRRPALGQREDAALRAALAALGAVPDGEEALVVEHPHGAPVRVRAEVGDDGWYTLAGALSEPVAFPAAGDPLLDRLQSWAPAGRFVADEHGRLQAELTSPLPADPGAADAAVTVLLDLLHAAYTRLPA